MKILVYLDTGRCIEWIERDDKPSAEFEELLVAWRQRTNCAIVGIGTAYGFVMVPVARIVSIDHVLPEEDSKGDDR